MKHRATGTRRPSASPTPLQERALVHIRTLVDALVHSARAVETRTGLTNAQLAVLRQLAGGPLSVSELAERVRAGQSAVSIIVGRLARGRLVRRFSSHGDRRRVMVDLTASGRRMLRRSPRPPTEQLLTALRALTPPQAAMLADGLDVLLRRMGVTLAGAPMLFEQRRRRR